MTTVKYTVLMSLVMCVEMTQMNVRTKLMNDKMIGYHTEVPPTNSTNLPVHIEIGFGIFNILEINEKEQSLSTNGWINIEWTDLRLAWNLSAYNVTDVYYKQQNIWVPDLSIVNTLREREPLDHEDSLCRVMNDGRVSWMPGNIFITTCEVDVTYFPFDTQICKIIITPWMLNKDVIKLAPIISPITEENSYDTLYVPQRATNSLWDVSGVIIRFDDKEYYVAGAIDIVISLKRCPVFYMINLILPLICISVLICLVFALPMEKGDRVGLSMNILLSFVVFLTLLGDHLPQTSRQTSLLTVYLTILLIISTLSIFLAVFNQRISNYSNSQDIPKWISNVLTERERKKNLKTDHRSKVDKNGDSQVNFNSGLVQSDTFITDQRDSDIPCITWVNAAEYLDHIFMVMFSIALLLTNVIYFTTVIVLTGWPHSC